MKRSAGILPYKIIDKDIYIYLEHPGGPYWDGINEWSICKGEYKKDLRQLMKQQFVNLVKSQEL